MDMLHNFAILPYTGHFLLIVGAFFMAMAMLVGCPEPKKDQPSRNIERNMKLLIAISYLLVIGGLVCFSLIPR